MNQILEEISRIGIIPVIAIDDADKAVALARALVAGGLPAAEVTFRTAAAEETMRRIIKEVPEMLVGAGTVLTHEQADRALNAGAKFIVSPGFNPDTVKYILSKGGVVMPGTATPGEMEQAMALGLDAVKFFPAEQNGGIAKIKAIASVYQNLVWMPTGGVTNKNMMDYLSFPQILACGGTWIAKKDLIESENWDEITRLCKEAVRTMLGFSLAHVGIACGDAENAAKTAKTLCAIFGFPYKEGNSSDFAGTAVECTKKPFPGTKGHIAISTHSVSRAIYQLARQGVTVDESTRKTDAKGNTKAIYLNGEFGGFAIHLVQD
ncbi:MAG: bifunctional 4-hydroxy-2-oxoglutarate aldolase/2-dehydro-3-deoxy-phosphogluconate aldolase [Oscillospiraceae bacterium]